MFLVVCILILLLSIYLGVRLGGLGIAFASGIGLFLYTMVLGLPPGSIPVGVILIIVSVIGAISVLEASGGLAYIVQIAERVLRSHPKYINFLAPMVTFFMTLLSGTGHTSYSIIPVIVEVAKRQGIKPVRPLSSAVVASQIAITASPITAAMVAFVGVLEPYGISMGQIIIIVLPSTFIACMMVAFIQSLFPQKLDEKLRSFKDSKKEDIRSSPQVNSHSKFSVMIFLLAVLGVVIYGLFPSLKPVYITGKPIDTTSLIIILMLLGSYVMVVISKVKVADLINQSTFKAGMSASLCVIGVAWLGDTFISYYKEDIKFLAGDILQTYYWTFSIVLFFMSMLLYSQAATTIAIMPLAVSIGLSPETMIASFAAVSALFVLPTYPTVIAAVQMDDTGSTKIGKYVFNHPFLFPGILAIFFSVMLGYIFAGIFL